MASLCCLLPFLYLDILFFRACMAFSSLDSLRAIFFSFLFSPFAPFFFAARTLRAIFFFRARILRMASLCCLLPFLYLDILFFRACMALSSLDSLRFIFFSFLFSPLAPFLAPFLFAARTLLAILLFRARIWRSAALCSLLPFLYLDILCFSARMALCSADSLCAIFFSFLFSPFAPFL